MLKGAGAAPVGATQLGVSFGDGDGLHVVAQTALDSRLLDVTVTTAALDGPVDVRILLPTGYANDPARRYPVLYLLPGTSGRAQDWTTLGGAEQTTSGQRERDGQESRQRQVRNVDVVRLPREEGQHDCRCIRHRADAEIDLGGEDDEGQPDRDHPCDGDLLQNVLEIAERRERWGGDAEEADENDQRRERRNVAKLIAQQPAEIEVTSFRARLAIGHGYLLRNEARDPSRPKS